MQNNFITNLLDLKDVKVTKFRNRKNRIRIHIELPVRDHTCPCCHAKTSKIHDYRSQLIKDIPIYYKDTFIYYRKRTIWAFGKYVLAKSLYSLLVPYSNGIMEGYNNKIKVLKRLAFGFRNFQNFKARILLLN